MESSLNRQVEDFMESSQAIHRITAHHHNFDKNDFSFSFRFCDPKLMMSAWKLWAVDEINKMNFQTSDSHFTASLNPEILILFLPTVSHKFLDSSFLFSLPETTHGW